MVCLEPMASGEFEYESYRKLLARGHSPERIGGRELASRFPEARCARMDSDTLGTRRAYEQVLGRCGAGEIDILVGTQMIAKGLDLPLMTLVGVVLADHGLRSGDFRARERTFPLLEQVAARPRKCSSS